VISTRGGQGHRRIRRLRSKQLLAALLPNLTPVGFPLDQSGSPETAKGKRFLDEAEGEGFEPSIRLTTDNGFRDRTKPPLLQEV
jgi:hypothetical protein